MQLPIGIGLMIGIFFWSGGYRIFDSWDNNSRAKHEKILTIKIDSVNHFWEDSLKYMNAKDWVRTRKIREYYSHIIDSLKHPEIKRSSYVSKRLNK